MLTPCQRSNIVYGGGGRDSNFMLNTIWKCAELDMYILHHCPKTFCHLFVGGGGAPIFNGYNFCPFSLKRTKHHIWKSYIWCLHFW